MARRWPVTHATLDGHMVQRFDVGRLDRAQRTGADGARVPASIARSGVQTYTDAAGNTVREYRPADEVFAATSLATLVSIPVTIGHPGRVDAKNWRQHAVGHVTDAPPARRDDGPHAWLDTTVHVNDARALERVNAGELVEVSMGYTADVVPEKGVAPDGQHYDAVQRNIRFNHLALLEYGRARAGRGARLRLDGNEVSATEENMKRIKIDGIECEAGSDTHIQMTEMVIARETKRADEAAKAQADALAAKDAELGQLKAKLDAVPAPVDTEKLVQDELDFRASMLPLVGKDYQFQGKSRSDVRYDAVGVEAAAKIRALPEGQREGYLQALLDAKASAADRPTHAPAPGAVAAVKADEASKKYNPYAVLNQAFADARK